jgi:U3 small nucleolar RNA-associated protein 7
VQRFDLNLETFAPYKIDYSREGTYLLMGGKKGHLALLDWRKNKLLTEVHVKETVRDVKYENSPPPWPPVMSIRSTHQ